MSADLFMISLAGFEGKTSHGLGKGKKGGSLGEMPPSLSKSPS